MGQVAQGTEVPVDESTERWSEFRLEDETVIRVKTTVASAIRIEGQYDPEGNPIYVIKSAPAVAIVHVPDILKKPTGQTH